MKRTILLALLCTLAASANAQNDPSATVGSTGTVTFDYGTDSVVYTTVRCADGKIWLQQNLGAAQVATSANDPAAYGHYFQWGRWADGHQAMNSPVANSSTISPNNPAGTPSGNPNFLLDWWGGGTSTDTWTDAMPGTTNGIDPCSAIGPGWHTPSTSEFVAAITAEQITDDITAFNSNLKIVVAGLRNGMGGGYTNEGFTGNYWTSTPSAQHAEIIRFVPLTVLSPDIVARSNGLSMRCVTTCTGVFPPAGLNGEDTVCEGSTQTYYIEDVDNADTYQWTVPTGWTIVGPSNTTVLTVIVGNTSGTINIEASNSCNNGSLSTLITVDPLPVPVIAQTGMTLSTGTYVTYQWLQTGNLIPGATNSSYLAPFPGIYHVIVTDANGCSDTSDAYHLPLSVGHTNIAESIKLYPNPTVDMLHIDAPMNVNVSIYSIDGRLVMSALNATQVDISALPSGTYHVKMTDKDGVTVRMERLSVLRQ